MKKKCKPGRGPKKGGAFEREICKLLSLWVSYGQRTDIFARSALSGGRATMLHRKGKLGGAVSGDIAAVHPLGMPLVSALFVECKHVKNAGFTQFFLHSKGMMAKFWWTAVNEAMKYDKTPMLILRQNLVEAIVVTAPHVFPFEVNSVVESGTGMAEPAYRWKLYLLRNLLAESYKDIEPWLANNDGKMIEQR